METFVSFCSIILTVQLAGIWLPVINGKQNLQNVSLIWTLNVAQGVSEIIQGNKRTLCSGTHLKPWIVLTIGDCVYNQHPDRLMVKVPIRKKGDNIYETVNLKVGDVVFNPEFKIGSKDNNFALILVKDNITWSGGEYDLAQKNYKPEDFIKNEMKTYVNYLIQNSNQKSATAIAIESRNISTTYSECGMSTRPSNLYCSTVSKRGIIYKNVQVGRPLYFIDGGRPRILGLYFGNHKGKYMKGHLHLSVFSNRHWVYDEIEKHPFNKSLPT